MSRGDRDNDLTVGIAALFVIVVGFSASLTMTSYRYEHARERKEIAAAEANQDRREIAIDCVGIGTSEQHCTAVLPPTESPNKATEYDLRAQQEMAEWALGMFIATVVGLVVSGFGLWALFVNLALQRKSTDHALSAATAGLLAAKISRGQSIAYVHAVSMHVTPKRGESGNALRSLFGQHASLHIQLENIGQTVARKVFVKFQIEDLTRGWNEYRDLAKPSVKPVANIAPQQLPVIQMVEDLEAIVDAANAAGSPDDNGVAMRIVRGEVSYEDVYENEYRSCFLFLMIFDREIVHADAPDHRIPCFDRSVGLPAFVLTKAAEDKK